MQCLYKCNVVELFTGFKTNYDPLYFITYFPYWKMFQIQFVDLNDMTALWDMVLCSLVEVNRRFINLMMEAVRTSETLVHFYDTTQRHIPEGCHLHT
jgi:hypothetical protein